MRVLKRCTPIGLVTVDYEGTKEVVKPKRNPFVSDDMKRIFLENLRAFQQYSKFDLSLVQR